MIINIIVTIVSLFEKLDKLVLKDIINKKDKKRIIKMMLEVFYESIF